MIAQANKSRQKTTQTTPLRIMVWALLISVFCGAIELGEPLEDLYRGARNMIRARPADGKVVIVGLDEKTCDRFETCNFSRKYDAQVIDRLIAAGVRHVYFDRAYTDRATPEEDVALVTALRNAHGKVSFGAMFSVDASKEKRKANSGAARSVTPHRIFREVAGVASLNGRTKPFGLSAEFPYADMIDGQKIHSVSANIAGFDGPTGVSYRPDWSIQMSTIPTVSMADMLDGKPATVPLQGRDVIVGPTAARLHDIHQIAGQGWVPGVYFHAVGAQTLREGTPRNWGWIPALVLATLFALLHVRCRNRKTAAFNMLAASAVLLSLPFAFDMWFITADFLPAYLLFGIVAYRSMTLRAINTAQRTHAGTLLPNLSALREEAQASALPLIAMRIRNYAAICSSFPQQIDTDLINELVRRLSLPGQKNVFYQAEDVLYWLAPRLTSSELADHIEGLARMVETQLILGERKIDVQVAFGIDDEYQRPVTSRIASALLAADRAASRNQIWRFHQSDSEGDTNWQLSLVGEMDAAMDRGDIWVAYQPQFAINNLRITGAEALVRWQHPERGSISPETFIIAAEEHNRILRLTLYVLERSTSEALRIVSRRKSFRLSVNLSATLLEHADLPARIDAVLKATQFPTANLTLEITETAHVGENSKANAVLAQLIGMGIQISIDDYGTGNATLDYLKSFPCDEVKIDRKFVTNLTSNASDRLMVESTIALAHRMGRRVIAEGIEDRATLDLLRHLGCDIAQGYHLGRPVKFQDLTFVVFPSRTPRAA